MDFTGLHEYSPKDKLIAFCKDAPVSSYLGGPPGGNQVYRISDRAVVKFGYGVTEKEADNQRRAYELVSRDIVRIPRVYRFFTDEEDVDTGYLVMEYIEGTVIEPLENPAYIEKVARVLAHFATLRGDIPGPLGGGPSRGLLWPENEDLSFESVEAMEEWFNSRLLPHESKLSFASCELVLCHLDIAPRNLLWTKDGSLGLVDWASAGYYPRLFEFCTQWVIEGKDGKFNTLVLDAMENLSDREEAQKWPVLRAWSNHQRYYFRPVNPSRNVMLVSRPPETNTKRSPAPAPVILPPYPEEWLEQVKLNAQ
ncbi:MAG: hypothetical protein M1837_000339 [Sclerophora amabilis]|nr:MAG: hypothetical protein M1837_000339 [Sclerophora amabilis]